jgi:hypothetical protein
LANISAEQAGHILVTMTRAGILDQYREARGDYYMISFRD